MVLPDNVLNEQIFEISSDDSHASSVEMCLLDEEDDALGWLLKEIHVTWAHLEKKQTRLQLYSKSDEENALPESQPKETYKEDLKCEMVMVKLPRCMSFLYSTNAYDEPICSLDRRNKVDNPSPQSTPQVIPSFKEYTPTYPKEVVETLGTPIEVELLDQMKLEDVGLDTCNHDIPLSSKEVSSFDEPEPQPQLLPNCSSLYVQYPIDVSESHLNLQEHSENKTSLLQQLVHVNKARAVMSSASSAVTYTSVYTDSKPGRAFWGVDDEEIPEGGIPRVIVLGYDRLPIQPVAPPSPDYIPGPEDPQTPSVPQDEDECEPMFVQAHDHDYPLPPVDSPSAESPGYVTESDLEEYEDDETEDGPTDYPEEDPEEYEVR
ncbi:hypothetical protein Tco_0058256 [Tanacetum coccineum]